MTNVKKRFNRYSTVNIEPEVHQELREFIATGIHDGINVVKFSSNAIREKIARMKNKEKKEGGFPETHIIGTIEGSDIALSNKRGNRGETLDTGHD